VIELDASQNAALAMALEEPIAIITGGPGTGKTTILREALARLEEGTRVALCAPTGKAAKRMTEATGVEAKTIHRLLGFNPMVRDFYHNANNPLAFDIVFADEASMIDVELFADLCDAIDERTTRLVLVGDANQLPSVGPGAILADLVHGELVPTARLDQVHRSAAKSWICSSAPKILAGEELDLSPRDDFRFVEVEDSAGVARAVGDALEEFAGAQILVPQRTGKAGADAINVELQSRFNPLRPLETQWGKAPHFLRTRDRVIHTKNNYNLGVFNGEVGEVAEINDSSKRMLIEFPDRAMPVEYTRADTFSLRLAYALTIHKSQGSEWPWVVVVVHNSHAFMLTRQLLYTAITRGKAGVVIVGNKRGISNALSSKRSTTRNTALAERIRGEL